MTGDSPRRPRCPANPISRCTAAKKRSQSVSAEGSKGMRTISFQKLHKDQGKKIWLKKEWTFYVK